MRTESMLWAVLVLTALPVLQGSTIYVSSESGSDTDGTGSAGHPFKSLTVALGALADSGADNITLMPGTYSGPENTGMRIAITSNTVRIVSQKGPDETFIGSITDYRVFQVGGEPRNGTTTFSLPYHPMNGTDDASTSAVRDDTWRGLVPNLVLSGLTIFGGTATKGGAVYVEGGVFKMLGCRVVMGGHGAVYVKGAESKVLAANTIFARNGAISRSGPQVLKSGGALFVEDGTFHCDACRFVNNSATQHGGAIYAVQGVIRLSNTNLTQNSAVEGGGGAVFLANTRAGSYIVSTNFRNNTAVRGGAVFAGGESSPQFINSTFYGNSVKHVGGAMLMTDSTHAGLKRVSFVRNSASTSGGAIAIMGNSSMALGLSFVHLNAAGSGGGLFVSGKATPRITNAIITENIANDGAGVMIGDNSRPFFDSCEIASNRASRGGAIYADDSCRPEFTNCRIKQNFASLDGGALYAVFDSAPAFDQCHFLDNTSNLGDPFHISRTAQDQIKFTMCSVFPHPNSFDEELMADVGFPEPLNVF